MTTLQTLDRGLAALALIADSAGLSVQALADALGVHKAIAYRIVATLEGHGLVARAPDGRVTLGAGTLALSARFAPHFQTEAARVLADLSRATGCTACIAVAEGDTCVVSQVHEAETGFMRLSYRVGVRHPLTQGATGLAILAGRAPAPDVCSPPGRCCRLRFPATTPSFRRASTSTSIAPVKRCGSRVTPTGFANRSRCGSPARTTRRANTASSCRPTSRASASRYACAS